MIGNGFLTKVISGVGSLIGLVSGLILGALIMYYLLKDGTSLRRSLVARIRDPALRDDVDDFIGDTCQILRHYARGRTIMSAIVAVVIGLAALLLGLPLVFTIIVVNFVGGYIPYIGAFLGGGLAVIVALGDGGLTKAAVMLIVVLASNLVLENFVEPKVMSRTLAIHPLIVLIVTALGGLLGGIVGLILAVPAYVIASDAISRFRSEASPRRSPAMPSRPCNACSTDVYPSITTAQDGPVPEILGAMTAGSVERCDLAPDALLLVSRPWRRHSHQGLHWDSCLVVTGRNRGFTDPWGAANPHLAPLG
jgi:predicted PurR-regulated permease PerM